MTTTTSKCWICNGADLHHYKDSGIDSALKSEDFAITDYNYGVTGTLVKCTNCGFIQCSDVENALSYYEDLTDEEYEEGREERALQADRILKTVLNRSQNKRSDQQPLRLLDVGAGSGILVEQAGLKGIEAVGIEPSEWLASRASARGIPVIRGTLPSDQIAGQFDIITIIDVIEHVDDPVGLVEAAKERLAPNGQLVIVTPDVKSMLARLLGFKWWHFRIAHICYFDLSTLERLAARLDLVILEAKRPNWYFQLSYLIKRAMSYLPKPVRISSPKTLDRVIIPLNLRDSWMVTLSRETKP